MTPAIGETPSSSKRFSRRAVAILSALGLSTGFLTSAPATAAVNDDSDSYTSNQKAKFADEVYFFDFGKLASGEVREDLWGAKKQENNEADFRGKRIVSGDSYTYGAAEGLPEGLEVKVTVNNVKAMHDSKYPLGDKAGEKIDDGIWARTVTWNDFFRPLDLSNPGSIDRDRLRSTAWFDPEVLYPSQPGAMLQLSNYLDPAGFENNADNQINQGYSFDLNVEGTLNGKPVDLDLLASDGESTGIRVQGHDNPYNSKWKEKGGVPENLQLTPNGEGGWVVVQDLVSKDGRYYYVDDKPSVPTRVPEGKKPYDPIEVDPNKVWTEENGAKTYGWVDTELDENGGPWKAIPQSQPLLVSRAATQISVELDNHPRGKTGSRQGVVAGIFLPTDQGDAPESYGEASHLLNNWKNTGTPKDPNNSPDIAFEEGNRVGEKIADRDGGKNWEADPEGATGDSEEDVDPQLFSEGFASGGKVTIPAVAENSDVVAWVDINQDGKFDDDERRVGKDNGDGTFTFDWSDAAAPCDGDQDFYARIRVGAEGVKEDQITSPTGTVYGGEVEDLKFTAKTTCSVSVGDFVWVDENRDGIQDEGEPGLAGVTLELVGPNGEAVTDVFGKAVENITTGEDGRYSFTGLPVLKDGESYTVKVVDVPEGYEPTKAEQGDDRAVDSSTDSASSASLTEGGQKDTTLDFGFVKTEEAQEPTEPGDSSEPSDEPTPAPKDPQESDEPTSPAAAEDSDAPSSTPAPAGEVDEPQKSEASDSADGAPLPRTGANIAALLAAGGAMILVGFAAVRAARRTRQ